MGLEVGTTRVTPKLCPAARGAALGRRPAPLPGLSWVEFLGSLEFVGFSCCFFGSILPRCPTSAHSSSHPLPLPRAGVPLLLSDCTAQDCDYENLPPNTKIGRAHV